jgi:uncharacterized protein YcbX
MIIGKISAIRRYPVKSMSGETLDLARITSNGLWGDRARALFDPTEKRVASAKHVDRFSGLLYFNAQYVKGEWQSSELPPVDVRFPDGRIVRTDTEEFVESLSKWFGKPTAISSITDDPSMRPQAGKYAMPDTYFDYAPLHLLTDTAMASLARNSPESLVTLERFRPNLLIESFEYGDYPENNWVTKRIRIGAEVLLQLTDPCPRCAVPTLAQHKLPKDAKLLKNIAATNTVHVPALQSDQPCLGAYAFVLHGGMVSLGDEVTLE